MNILKNTVIENITNATDTAVINDITVIKKILVEGLIRNRGGSTVELSEN